MFGLRYRPPSIHVLSAQGYLLLNAWDKSEAEIGTHFRLFPPVSLLDLFLVSLLSNGRTASSHRAKKMPHSNGSHRIVPFLVVVTAAFPPARRAIPPTSDF